MKRLLAIVIATILCLSLFSGCQKKSGSVETTQGKTESTQGQGAQQQGGNDEKREAKPVTLKFLCDNENFQDRLKTFIEDYKSKSGNDVEVQLFPATEYDNIIKTKMMAGEGPDLYRTDDILMSEYQWPKDWPLDLKDRPWVSRLSEGGKSLITWSNGMITGLPITNPSGFGIMYNKAIFKELGINELPQSWNEFLAMCDKIKQAGYIPFNIQLANGSEFGTTHLMHQLFANVELTRKDSIDEFWKSINANQLKLADVSEYEQALNQMIELKNKGYINEDFISNTFEMAQEKFGTGKVAMHPCGDFILSPLVANYPEIDVGFFPAPFGDGPGVIGLYSGVGLSVNAKAENLDQAIDFIDYFASKEAQEKYMESSPGTNVFSDVNAKSNMISKDLDIYMKEGRAVNGILTKFEAWPEMECRKIMQEYMLGEMTAKQMLEELDKKAEIIAKGKNLEGW
ncbi:MAG: ABC transporter substrate-binding protein [Acetivibrionales bacterium]